MNDSIMLISDWPCRAENRSPGKRRNSVRIQLDSITFFILLLSVLSRVPASALSNKSKLACPTIYSGVECMGRTLLTS